MRHACCRKRRPASAGTAGVRNSARQVHLPAIALSDRTRLAAESRLVAVLGAACISFKLNQFTGNIVCEAERADLHFKVRARREVRWLRIFHGHFTLGNLEAPFSVNFQNIRAIALVSASSSSFSSHSWADIVLFFTRRRNVRWPGTPTDLHLSSLRDPYYIAVVSCSFDLISFHICSPQKNCYSEVCQTNSKEIIHHRSPRGATALVDGRAVRARRRSKCYASSLDRGLYRPCCAVYKCTPFHWLRHDGLVEITVYPRYRFSSDDRVHGQLGYVRTPFGTPGTRSWSRSTQSWLRRRTTTGPRSRCAQCSAGRWRTLR